VPVKVEVIAAFPRKATPVTVDLPDGATVLDALRKAGLGKENAVGIFGEPAALETRLRDGDRVEVYRPLKIDPKEARRRRAKLAR
jgi:putative ubiquitin-RnfH superfamily antitoxin RatB of RatAB toxin-antitoxin module